MCKQLVTGEMLCTCVLLQVGGLNVQEKPGNVIAHGPHSSSPRIYSNEVVWHVFNQGVCVAANESGH